MYEASTGGSSPSVLVVKPMFLNNVSPRVVTLTLRDERERRDERRETRDERRETRGEMTEKRQETRDKGEKRRETRDKRKKAREKGRERRGGSRRALVLLLTAPNPHPSSPSSFTSVVTVFVVSCETHRAGKFI